MSNDLSNSAGANYDMRQASLMYRGDSEAIHLEPEQGLHSLPDMCTPGYMHTHSACSREVAECSRPQEVHRRRQQNNWNNNNALAPFSRKLPHKHAA